jgi:type II secretory pathway pseudopilin PulG
MKKLKSEKGFTLQLFQRTQFKSLNYIKKSAGFTIIEIIVVIAVIITAIGTILGFFVFDAKIVERNQERLKALSLAEEAIEAVRNFRDNTDWGTDGIATLTVDTDYYPASSSNGWSIVLGDENINGFIRKINLSRVSRDTNDNIEGTYNPLNDDPNTRKVAAVVSWTDRQGQASESLTTYITNWRK